MRLRLLGYNLGAHSFASNDEACATDASGLRDGCGLTGGAAALGCAVMLQHNAPSRHAHLAHAAVVGMHVFCCGLPAAAMLAAGLSGAASAGALLPESFRIFHHFLHNYELWIVAVSAGLVALGGWLELRAHRRGHGHGVPWLFAFSVLCFFVNVGVILAHRA
jgi:hypothetical protein